MRIRKLFATTAVGLMLLNSGCAVNEITRPNVSEVAQPLQEEDQLIGITTMTGAEIVFAPPGGLIRGGEILATVNGAPYRIALADVQRLWIQRREFSVLRTAGLTGGIVVGVPLALVAAAAAAGLFGSCPYVYTWDGTQYVFDADPFAGAITKGLERDDYSELEHLRAQNGLYRLLMTNEEDETQFTNVMELWVVDHAPKARIVSDEHGNLRGYTDIQSLSAAEDRYGADIVLWLNAKDRKIWEPEAVAGPDGALTQEVVLTFPMVEGATQANLIANISTGAWGSYMIKQMVGLHGRETASWLGALDKNPDSVNALYAWGEREGVYRLAVEVEEPTGWVKRGALPAGGPYTAEDRVLSLDVSQVRGQELRIRLRPPVGFWAFNSFAVAYGAGDAFDVKRLTASSAETSDERSVLAALASTDAHYYEMSQTGDRAELIFVSPPETPGMARTTFLHSRGWYRSHAQNNFEPDDAAFAKIMTVPGAAVQFGADRFVEWKRGVPD